MDFKTLSLIAAVLLAATTIDSVQNTEFEQFEVDFARHYSSESEENYRRGVFNDNVAMIEAHNADETQTYKMAVNEFTDMTDFEFNNIILMTEFNDNTVVLEDYEVVGNVNWVEAGHVTAVRDQGRCGSCWAFGAAAVVESFKSIQQGTHSNLSEQQLTSCDRVSNGCSGGLALYGLTHWASAGICTEASYPYTSGSTGNSGTCMESNCTRDSYSINGETTGAGLSYLENMLQTGPVSVSVDAGGWSGYSSGIFSNCGQNTNHAVLVSGYTSQYWLVKNSWGASWGESGYIRLAPGNTCNLSRRCTTPR